MALLRYIPLGSQDNYSQFIISSSLMNGSGYMLKQNLLVNYFSCLFSVLRLEGWSERFASGHQWKHSSGLRH